MDDIDLKELESVKANVDCPKDFICIKNRLENLCKAEDLGLDEFLECLQENPSVCPFSFRFGNKYFCKCEVRFYLAKKYAK